MHMKESQIQAALKKAKRTTGVLYAVWRVGLSEQDGDWGLYKIQISTETCLCKKYLIKSTGWQLTGKYGLIGPFDSSLFYVGPTLACLTTNYWEAYRQFTKLGALR